jgi:glycosyltransferase involved in cell wall biosynthesis
MKQFRALVWRHAPDLSQAISARLPALRAYRRYGWRRRPTRSTGPVTVAGFHGAILGLGEGARGLVDALVQADMSTYAWDVSEALGHARRLNRGDEAPPPQGKGVFIAHMNPPELIQLIASTGPAPFEGKRIIGYWAWELPDIPREWKAAFRYVDEVWAPSAFTAQAIRRSAPRRLPVRIMPHPVPIGDVEPARARYGLDPDRVIVLSAFDFRSTLARKNPLAALDAFRRATAMTRRPATLVFKTVGGGDAPAELATLKAMIGDSPDVVLLTNSMSAQDRDSLLASCDIFLSLHRSEGFGLLMAEAMAAGKAVVATGWSGNLDFMDDGSAVLVPYTLQPVHDPQGLYRGGVWAQADTDAASQALAGLIDNPDRRAALGAKARDMVRRRLALPVVAKLIRDRVEDWAAPNAPSQGRSGEY